MMDFLKKISKLSDVLLLLGYEKYKKLGIPKNDYRKLLISKVKMEKTKIFKNDFYFTDKFWFLHSLNEIFIDEVYRFRNSNKSPVIIDCGSNIGLSILYFKTKYPEAKIIGFEPDPEIFQILLKNTSFLNSSDIQLYNKAVFSSNTNLYFASTGNLGGSLSEDTSIVNTNLKLVSCIRLKDYLSSKIDFLKIDIEGSEIEVINDCKDLLHNVENLFVEYHSKPSNIQELDILLKILTTNGFRYYIKEAWNNFPYPFDRVNYNPHFDLQLNIFAYK